MEQWSFTTASPTPIGATIHRFKPEQKKNQFSRKEVEEERRVGEGRGGTKEKGRD